MRGVISREHTTLDFSMDVSRLASMELGYIKEETIVLVNAVGVKEDNHTVEIMEQLIFWYGRDTRGENIVKIQNTHQVEMRNINKFVDSVKMVITKLVEWAGKVVDKVVNITGRKVDTVRAMYKAYKMKSGAVMGELLTYQCLRDTRIQVKGTVVEIVEWARVVINKVVYTTVGKAKHMVYVKQMLGQHTHTVERDTRRQIEEEQGKERNIFLPEDTNMGNMVIFEFEKVIEMVVDRVQEEFTVKEGTSTCSMTST